ncbi:MAG: hypothetical protein EOO30_05830 [Comamonadaceae bacterium]|nr:MAG: hypothetical protein EOO30_05830 [Comamonadaceae bacterium]
MFRMLAVLAVVFYALVAALWVVGFLPPEEVRPLLVKGSAVLGILAVAAGVIALIVRTRKSPVHEPPR